MMDLVVISLEAWDEVWRRNQHLVAGLVRRGTVRRVLFVEPPDDPLHELRSGRRPKLPQRGLRRVPMEGAGGEVWTVRPTKLLPRRLDGGGDRRRARSVVRAAGRLGLTRPVLWVNDPGGAEVLSVTGWPAMYDITDDWLVADRPEPELARLRRQEADLLATCGEVVVCSEALLRSKSPAREVVLIPNAVDLEPYRVLQPRPDDLPPGPVVLYLGTVHRDRIDVDLVVETAARLAVGPDGVVVMVGPAPLPPADVDRLTAAGVHLLGPRPSNAVPAYLQHSSVLIVPHVLTDFTASLDPIKAYEYRAARRPVVATPVPGFVDQADPWVECVEAEGFPDAVTEAVARSGAWRADLPDDIPSWELRVTEMSSVLARLEAQAR